MGQFYYASISKPVNHFTFTNFSYSLCTKQDTKFVKAHQFFKEISFKKTTKKSQILLTES